MIKMKMPKNMWICFFVLVAIIAFIWMYTSNMNEGFTDTYTPNDAQLLIASYQRWVNSQSRMGTPVNQDIIRAIDTNLSKMKVIALKNVDKQNNRKLYNEIVKYSGGAVS